MLPPYRRTQSVEETEEEDVTARAGGTRPKLHSDRSANFENLLRSSHN
jgi:hypothetical protein